jgi:S-DNA-T family DNA segregation ATPase FtsK/SpoIIIE
MEGRYQLLARAGCKNIETYNERAGAGHKLSRIVIVIDEWSDLFASQGKSVEALVSRLAQKARAAGMHIILATQRPSVDVITGVIKANFPTRVAYRVAQRVDSRVVLDEQGAEQLAGRGDMLVKMNGSDALLRAQCPMISEVEIEALTGYLCTQGMPDYDESILDPVPALEKKPGGRKGVSAKVLS